MELEIYSVWYTDGQHLIRLTYCTHEKNPWKKRKRLNDIVDSRYWEV